MKNQLAVLTLPFALAACSSTGDLAQVSADDLQHHSWTLTKIDSEVLVTPSLMQAPNLEIGEKLTANGNAGCNNFFGQGELKNNQFRITGMGMTMKMCMGEAMKTEATFAQSLAEWNDIILTKETLVLKNGTHTLTFKLSDWK